MYMPHHKLLHLDHRCSYHGLTMLWFIFRNTTTDSQSWGRMILTGITVEDFTAINLSLNSLEILYVKYSNFTSLINLNQHSMSSFYSIFFSVKWVIMSKLAKMVSLNRDVICSVGSILDFIFATRKLIFIKLFICTIRRMWK